MKHAGLILVAGLIGLVVGPIRRKCVTVWIMRFVAGVLPKLGDTERVALEAGTVWWDGDLFSGAPNWRKLLSLPVPALHVREKAFLEGPVEQLCKLLNDWEIRQDRDLSPEVWEFIKQHGFFGLIIPEVQGGHGFSAIAHSAIIVKIASRSVTAAVTVMVPNSLGPAELLLHYGTSAQKSYYLPRLARGEEIPCFALTGPEAGSDAAATQSTGIICRGIFEGKEVVGMRLNWRKRYITLGPVATVIGLAFRLKDPDKILGDKEDLGITCALIPARLQGITIGERHDPMGVPFQNGPNLGKDVFVPIDFIIGGAAAAGKGWQMLMESLAAGRSISLPSLSVAGMEVATRVVGAYATVREQFDTPIGRFEGIEEPLARIGGLTYMMNAARVMTAGAVDLGEKPSVVSAIVKTYLTESMRKVVGDAMDIRAGAAICRGPRNMLEQLYAAVPIGITVEGANILTRSMIIYGQGAIRCHPFVRDEISAIERNDLRAFDRAFWGHLFFVIRNTCRAFFRAVTGSCWGRTPVSGLPARYIRRINRMSSAFALISDASMALLGGKLKRHEKLSGRLADALAWMYLASAAIKKFNDEGQKSAHLPFFQWSCDHALFQVQEALGGILLNFPNRAVGWLLSRLIFPFGRRYRRPSDLVGAQVARGLLEDHSTRRDITSDIFIPASDEVGLGRLEAALKEATVALSIETKIRDAIRAGKIDKASGDVLLERAIEKDIITREERDQVLQAQRIRDEVIQVDAFTPDDFRNLHGR